MVTPCNRSFKENDASEQFLKVLRSRLSTSLQLNCCHSDIICQMSLIMTLLNSLYMLTQSGKVLFLTGEAKPRKSLVVGQSGVSKICQ